MKKIILSGGGTLGSVTPLIALKQSFEKKYGAKTAEFLWIGTKDGIEKDFVHNQYKIKYKGISSGKMRRYFSWQNFIDPFKMIWGVFESFKIIKNYRPDVIVTAGSFVSVPLVIAAWIKKVPIVMHHLDLQVGWSNKIIAPFASLINVSFKKNIKDFSKEKIVCFGNPVRQELLNGNPKKAIEKYNLNPSVPTILAIGGSTGAVELNRIINNSANQLSENANIIHIAGKDKGGFISKNKFKNPYIIEEFISEGLEDIFAVSDIVITRSGLATIAEFLVLEKPMVLIPIPHNQQEVNAEYLSEHNAGIVLDQETLDEETLIKTVSELLLDKAQLEILKVNSEKLMSSDAGDKFAQEIKKRFL